MNRRAFHKTLAATAFTASSYAQITGANDRVRLGFIGVGNRGVSIHRSAGATFAAPQSLARCRARRSTATAAAPRCG